MVRRFNRKQTGFRLKFERLTQRKLMAGDLNGGGTEADDNSDDVPAEEGPAEPGDPDADSGYTVTIYVDQPGDGGDDDVYEGLPYIDLDVGHTWIEVENPDGETTSGGLYPANGNTEDEGVIVDDSENDHQYDVYATFPISQEEYEAIVQQLEEDEQNPPDYDVHDNNCTTYAIDIIEDNTDIEIETEPDTYLGDEGLNPGSLGEDLVENYDGTYDPNSGGGGDSSGDDSSYK